MVSDQTWTNFSQSRKKKFQTTATRKTLCFQLVLQPPFIKPPKPPIKKTNHLEVILQKVSQSHCSSLLIPTLISYPFLIIPKHFSFNFIWWLTNLILISLPCFVHLGVWGFPIYSWPCPLEVLGVSPEPSLRCEMSQQN